MNHRVTAISRDRGVVVPADANLGLVLAAPAGAPNQRDHSNLIAMKLEHQGESSKVCPAARGAILDSLDLPPGESSADSGRRFSLLQLHS